MLPLGPNVWPLNCGEVVLMMVILVTLASDAVAPATRAAAAATTTPRLFPNVAMRNPLLGRDTAPCRVPKSMRAAAMSGEFGELGGGFRERLFGVECWRAWVLIPERARVGGNLECRGGLLGASHGRGGHRARDEGGRG